MTAIEPRTITEIDIADDDQLDRWLAVRNAIDPRPLTRAGFRAELGAAVVHFEFLASLGGNDVGAAGGGWGAMMADSKTTFLEAWVLPSARRRGIGSDLLARCLDVAIAHGMVIGRAGVLDGDEGSITFGARYGLEPVGVGQVGFLDLTSRHAEEHATPPPDVTLASLAERPDLERAIYDLDITVQPEIPTLALEPIPSFESWREQMFGDIGFLPDLSLVALRDGSVVGSIHVFDNAEGTAFIGMTAVHPSARREGIARALKLELAARAARSGWRRIETFNDGSNERMRALNVDLGYAYHPRHILLKGTLIRPGSPG